MQLRTTAHQAIQLEWPNKANLAYVSILPNVLSRRRKESIHIIRNTSTT